MIITILCTSIKIQHIFCCIVNKFFYISDDQVVVVLKRWCHRCNMNEEVKRRRIFLVGCV